MLRVATFNVADLRTSELSDPANPRVRAIAAILQRLRPDVVLLNEITFDQEGSPGWDHRDARGSNGRRLVEHFLSVSQGEGLAPLQYSVFMAATNTGLASGFDLDNDGNIVSRIPAAVPDAGSKAAIDRDDGRLYGGDAWGFGAYPGQYGMALLVAPDLEILDRQIRTFQRFRWAAMPGALIPRDPESGAPWYSAEEWSAMPLSSKSHWDVPVRLANQIVVHFLASHPTPPAFDGPEERNRLRNHDEIRFWGDYLSNADYITDDSGVRGGLRPATPFVILGDLNADPHKGRSYGNPVRRWLLDHPRVQGSFVPSWQGESRDAESKLLSTDTAVWRMRVDYVLPSVEFEIVDGGIERHPPDAPRISDHFPVWLDLSIASSATSP